jgi:hydrogenase maturation protease
MIKETDACPQQGYRDDIVVIAIGQGLRGDDGAGLEAVRFWQEKYPQSAASVRVEIMESPGLELLDEVNGVRAAIIVDAFQASSPLGSIVRLAVEDLAAFSCPEKSAHGWGLAETLKLGHILHPRLGDVPVILLGIVGKEFK